MFGGLHRRGLLIGIAGLLLTGCGTKTPLTAATPSGPSSADFSSIPQTSPSGDVADPNSIVSTDPSAVRLQDIGGYVMLYYREHGQMAPTLQDIADMPGGQELNFTCATGEDFVYEPSGMWSPEHGDKCIIIYDPALRDGKHWCLFMNLPKAGAPLSVDVVDLPDPFFENYRP